MFGLLEQTAMGVWLSTLISAAVTVATPIITATVKATSTTAVSARLPGIALAHFCTATWACQLTWVTTDLLTWECPFLMSRWETGYFAAAWGRQRPWCSFIFLSTSMSIHVGPCVAFAHTVCIFETCLIFVVFLFFFSGHKQFVVLISRVCSAFLNEKNQDNIQPTQRNKMLAFCVSVNVTCVHLRGIMSTFLQSVSYHIQIACIWGNFHIRRRRRWGGA